MPKIFLTVMIIIGVTLICTNLYALVCAKRLTQSHDERMREDEEQELWLHEYRLKNAKHKTEAM